MRTLGVALAGLAAGTLVAGRVYHIALHPEWTEPQALIALWEVWAIGFLLGAGALLVLLWRGVNG